MSTSGGCGASTRAFQISRSVSLLASSGAILGIAWRLASSGRGTAARGRTSGVFDSFSMWMSDVHSVGGYTFGASLFFLGLTGWQVLISMVVFIVFGLINLIGRPSQRYGIPYPVMARVSFGVRGANLAAIIRGVVGIVWYGVQTYIASKAVQVLVLILAPGAAALATTTSSGSPPWAGRAFSSCGGSNSSSSAAAWRPSASSSISAARRSMG